MEIKILDVLISVLSLLILVIPGYILVKLKVLPKGAKETCSIVVLYVGQSALVFMCFQKSAYSPEIGLNMLITFGLAMALHLLFYLIVRFAVRGSNESKLCVMRYASVFENCGFMGIPFLQVLFKGEAQSEILIYAAAIVVVFNILNWTLGVYVMTGDRKQISLKKIACNPVIICLILGAILFFAIQKPLISLFEEGSVGHSIFNKIISSVELMSNTVTPLSMFVIGMRLAKMTPKTLLCDKHAYVVSGFKLLVASLITILTVTFLPIALEIKYALVLLTSMPCATSSALFAINYNRDSNFGSVCVLHSTVFSIVSIPLTFLLFTTLLGLV